MAEVLEAQRAYKQADKDALKMRFRARARLGLTIVNQLERPGETLVGIAKEMGVVDEQVRRYRQAYRDWVAKYPDEPLI